jgi:hypothetical protein
MLVENITIRLGAGVTIGIVPPNDNINCIRNVVFRNVDVQRLFKGLHIKTIQRLSKYKYDVCLKFPISLIIFINN